MELLRIEMIGTIQMAVLKCFGRAVGLDFVIGEIVGFTIIYDCWIWNGQARCRNGVVLGEFENILMGIFKNTNCFHM